MEKDASVQGRALLIGATGSLYVSRRYAICRSDDGGRTWSLDCRVPAEGWTPRVARISLAARLLRFNIQAFRVLKDGARVAIARDGIYRAEAGEVEMRRTWAVTRGSRPINLAAEGHRLLFGEYGRVEMDTFHVRIFLSEDGGKSFEPAYEFPKGAVHHIHNIVVDPYADHYWVLAGDHGRQAGIGALSRDCRHLEWVVRGSQMGRAVRALVRPDCLLYGSDSELEPNYIVRLDRKTGRYERLMPIEGSSLYATDFGNMGTISTSVEPSKVNGGNQCSLYASPDGSNWGKLLSLRKDPWNAFLFGIALIVLPCVEGSQPPLGMFSGQALAAHHDRTTLFRV